MCIAECILIQEITCPVAVSHIFPLRFVERVEAYRVGPVRIVGALACPFQAFVAGDVTGTPGSVEYGDVFQFQVDIRVGSFVREDRGAFPGKVVIVAYLDAVAATLFRGYQDDTEGGTRPVDGCGGGVFQHRKGFDVFRKQPVQFFGIRGDAVYQDQRAATVDGGFSTDIDFSSLSRFAAGEVDVQVGDHSLQTF